MSFVCMRLCVCFAWRHLGWEVCVPYTKTYPFIHTYTYSKVKVEVSSCELYRSELEVASCNDQL